jgi:cell division control protein 6
MEKDQIDKILDDVESGKSLLFKNREILRVTYRPEKILHRDKELADVTKSLSTILKKARPSNILIYGKPGTGKTLVVRSILSKIQERAQKTTYPIKLIYINAKEESTLYGLLTKFGLELGLRLKQPKEQPNDELWLPRTGLSIGIVFDRIVNIIQLKQLNVIFIIDEIDNLAELVSETGNDVLYQLTRANTRLNNKGTLTIVGISNDLTFKERLDPRVISSLNEEEIIFTNYTTDQIRDILNDRSGQAFVEGVLDTSALNLCAAMAGQEHGDARRAIDLMRVAGELAERENARKITATHIKEAQQKIEESKEIVALQSYPLHEKLLIVAIMKADGRSTGEIYSIYKDLCKITRQKELTSRRVTQMLSDIELSGIIIGKIVSQGIHGRTKKYKLMISPDTIKNTFKNEIVLGDVI